MKITNQRECNRHSLIYQLSVLKHDTRELLGYIVDISLQGAMLISETPIPIEKRIRLLIVLPVGFPNEAYLDIEAESVRICRDINPDYYDSGFRFLSINSQQQETISYLIEEYGF